MLIRYSNPAIAILGLFFLSTTLNHAQTIAYDVPAQTGNQAWNGNLGLDFDVNSPIMILKLGAFDANGDGFSGTVQVAIFNRDTSLPVTSTATFTGTAGTLVNGSRFLSLSPAVVLPVGHYSVVAVGFNNTDMNGNLGVAGAVASTENSGSGLISFVGTARYDANTSLDLPGNIDGGPANRYLAGTFQFTTNAPAVAPVLTTSFGSTSMNIGETTALIFTVQNFNAVPITGVAFSDTLPSGLTVGTPNGLTGSCGSGTVTATGTSIGLSGGTIAASGSCTFSVNVTAIGAGAQNNTTSTVTSNEAPIGAAAQASVFVYSWWLWFY